MSLVRRSPPGGLIVIGLLVFLVSAVLWEADPARAHDRSISWSRWWVSGSESGTQLSARLRLRAFDLERYRSGAQLLGGRMPVQLASQLAVTVNGHRCKAHSARRLAGSPDLALFEWELDCPAQGVVVIRSDLLAPLLPQHMNMGRLFDAEGKEHEFLLGAGRRSWTQASSGPSQEPASSSAWDDFVGSGFLHAVGGYDHLVFLLALLLGGTAFKEMLAVVTGFTLAHSLTLGLTVTGLLRPDAYAVEALIALSIIIVSVENAWLAGGRSSTLTRWTPLFIAVLALPAAMGLLAVSVTSMLGMAVFSACYFRLLGGSDRPGRLRWFCAVVFGLLHGFGFAGALLEDSRAQTSILSALVGFNVGVELGQLAALSLMWPLLGFAEGFARRVGGAPAVRGLTRVGAATTLALGTWWFTGRAFQQLAIGG